MENEILNKAKSLYAISTDSEKKLLESIFGESITNKPENPVKSEDVTERVYNLETACQELGKDIGTLFGNETSPYRKAEIAIETFAEAMSQGCPDKKRVYYPYFYLSAGGRFSSHASAADSGYSSVGARLRVPDKNKAIHMGKCMVEYYRIYLQSTQ